MNPQGQAPPQGQAQGQPAAGQQPRPPPMYQPNQIRNLPMLSDEEKNKYEQGLRGLWNKANNSPANSPDQIAARQKIIEFSKMLISKIQQRRTQAQQQAAAQQQLQGGQAPARPPSGQQNAAGQAAPTAPPPGQQQQQQQQQPKPQQPAAPSATGATGQAVANSGATNQAQNPQAAAAAAAAQRPKIPDGITQHVNKMTFRPPTQLASKSPAEIAKWVEDIKEKYARALFTMESSKSKIAGWEKVFKERAAAGRPLGEEENKQYQLRREQQLKFYSDAHKWVESVRKQQESLQGGGQQAAAGQTGNASTAATGQPADNSQVAANAAAAANRNQNTAQTAAGSVNTAVEAAKNQQQNRASPANGTSTPTQAQAQARPPPQQAQQPQGQPQIKTEQPHPPPVNTAQAQAAAQAQQAGRVPTPQQANTPVTAGGPTRALSHSAAMTLANQRAAGTPNSAPGQAPQPGAAAAPAVANNAAAMNQGAVGPGAVQQQQGHPHAHPTQQQTGFQAKMPIPKQLPERATAVPQGVAVGGGVSAGRPTMSQGSGTLGGVMNQPPVARIPAYSHDAEGDHVLSKKKLDELVKQVVGGTGDTQDGNMLTPEVEESVLNMADSFVDNVLHVACRNAKERGSKVLEIRDIQLVLERTYNIRVPGYSSDELRTVRKVQPSPGWIAKMSAVQAAKVMPGKGDL